MAISDKMRFIMRNHIAISGFVFGVLLFSGCKNETKNKITGTVFQSEEVIISELSPQQLIPLDTVLIKNGTFSYTPKTDQPIFLLFEFDSGSRIPVLFTPGEQISLSINDTVPFGTFVAEGSKSTQRMARQREALVATSRFLDSLNFVIELYADSANYTLMRNKLNDAFDDRMAAHNAILRQIIDEDTNDLGNIMAFYQSLGNLDFMDVNQDYAYFKKVNNGLQANYPENEHAKYLNEKLAGYAEAQLRQVRVDQAALRVQIGNPAPEISLPDLDGKLRNLTDLRGKVVLIDFWASWCGPCRRANPDLVKLYEKYQSKGFDVFSVSLDGIPQQGNAKNDWRFAIENDKLNWPNHVSDLKGYNSAVVEVYGFEGIPFTILVNREGVIIAKNVPLNQLESELKKAL
jgi:thiol-disulfide isomerase/thioredoxin